ncbi:hypothetical protein LOD99_3310 [Oopsacas minuta]|uniref:N-terminal acetyltransferase B complex subunit NAA25 homolog n=1 Tax=Oopsacas minuta TaxID=111878 RepID=A0AAV7JY25_9METZ|nr:hypothetical protein LOD99_3310 [Oopsacas minuta]
MAENKSQSEVQERRLKPVYDLIEKSNYKGAVQQIDRIVKKHGQTPSAMAMKALALNRMNKRELCLDILDKMKDDIPTDPYTLQSMAFCYKDTRKFEEIALMYAAALKKQPKNEELMTRLFMAHVSNDEYQKQKQIALELHKLFPNNNPYYFWAVMSIVMQIHASHDEQTKSVLIPLAERMAERYKDKFTNANELKLYLNILKLNRRFEDILYYTRLSPETKLKIEEDEQFSLELECLTKLERWEEALYCYKIRCDTVKDDWTAFKGIIKCSLELHRISQRAPLLPKQQNPDIEEADKTNVGSFSVENTVDYIDEKCQFQIDKKANYLRAPFLARIELIIQLRENDIIVTRIPDIMCSLKEYFELFGAKKCWFDDMTLFIDRLADSEITQFNIWMEKLVTESAVTQEAATPDQHKQIKHLQRDINLLYITRYSGRHDQLSVEEKRDLISELMRKHYLGLPLGTSLNDTEFQYSDPYANVATHLLVDLYSITGDKCYLLEALMVASAVLKTSGKNYLARLMILKIQAFLGGIEVCTDNYMELEIKHLQAESLSYLLERASHTLGLPSAFTAIASNCQVLHRSNRRDTSEYIETAYKNGNFEKVLEMVCFKNRLSNSYYKKSIDLSSLLYSWIDGFSNPKLTELKNHLPSFESWFDVVKGLDSETYEDNRDLNVIEDYTPSIRKFTDKDVKDTFNAECIWIRMRGTLITCIGSLVEVCLLYTELDGNIIKTKDGAVNEGAIRWQELISLFEKGLDNFDKEIEAAVTHPSYALAAQTNTEYSLAKLRSPQLPMLELLIPPNKNAQVIRSFFKLLQSVLRSIAESKSIEMDVQFLAVPLIEIMKEISNEEFMQGTFDRIFLTVEKITTLLFTISIINICMVCVFTLVSPKTKKSKKAKQSSKFPDTSEDINTLNTFITSTLIPVYKELQIYVTNALAYFNDIDLDYFLRNVMKIQPDTELQSTSLTYDVRKRTLLELTSSYTTSLEKIGFAIDNRIKLLEQI